MCQGISECELLVGTRFAEGIMASGRSRRFKGRTHGRTDQLSISRHEYPCQRGAVHTWHF
jgi:hypothetical protein